MKDIVYLFRCVLVITIVAIFMLAIAPSNTDPIPISIRFVGIDKIEHISAFFTLSILGYYSFPSAIFWKSIALFLILFGVGIEVAQSFTPDRCPDVKDVIADVIGIIGFSVVKSILHYEVRNEIAVSN